MSSLTPNSNNILTKSSPFGGGISKKLLTPCRQVGLSRKRKTPSSISKTISEVLGDDTTPVNHKKSNLRNSSNESTSKLQEDVNSSVKVKKRISKKLAMDPIGSLNSNEILNEKLKIISDNQKVELKNLKVVIENEMITENVTSSKGCSENNLQIETENTESLTIPRSLNEPIEFNPKTEENVKIPTSSKETKKRPREKEQNNSKRKLKKTLSMKKSASFEILSDDDEIIFDSPVEHNEIAILSSSKSELIPNQDFESNIIDESDDDAFTSTPENDSMKRLQLLKDLKKLESDIKRKKQKVDELKRAEIYRNRHNVSELTQLSDLWLKGCLNGLDDLLKQLRETRPNIDLTVLIRELKIPDDIVIKLQPLITNV